MIQDEEYIQAQEYLHGNCCDSIGARCSGRLIYNDSSQEMGYIVVISGNRSSDFKNISEVKSYIRNKSKKYKGELYFHVYLYVKDLYSSYDNYHEEIVYDGYAVNGRIINWEKR